MNSRYMKYILIAKKYNLRILDEKIIIAEFNKNINFNNLFINMNNLSYITIQNCVNKYIRENIMSEYGKNYFFQYSIFILSDYYYKNKYQFLSALENVYECLKNVNIKKLDEIIAYLKKNNNIIINIKEKKEIEEFCVKVNKFFKNNKVMDFIIRNFNNTELINYLDCDNYFIGQSFETNFLKALILLKGNIDVDDILKNIKYSNDILLYCLGKLKENLNITDETKENKIKFLNYINDVYVKNGYFFHGTTSKSINYIKNNDLSSQYTDKCEKYVRMINKIFEKHNIYRAFEGKINELKTFNFYVTDDPFSAIYYANQSPEYLSRFCANGGNMCDTLIYDINAFWRRDYVTCKKNINKFMKINNFSEYEISIVNKYFDRLWKRNVTNNQFPILFIGKRKYINMDYTLKFKNVEKNLDKFSFKQILDYMLTPDNIHDKQLSKISYEYLSIIELPNIYQFYDIKGVINKRFLIYNDEKIVPDIIVLAPFQKKIYIKITDKDNILFDKNVIFISGNIELLNKSIKDNFYHQNIDILISDSAIGLTMDGIKLIEKIRQIYSVEYLINYYRDKINQMIENTISDVGELFRLVDNYYIKYRCMKKYNEYYANISAGKIDTEHYKVDNNNYMYKYKQTKLIEEKNINKIVLAVKEEMSKE